ncbi:hypothetical protein K2X05_14315, partial [bacterium]|nr:hypothetical protein [bacterium]
ALLHFEKKEAQLYLLSFEGVIPLDRFSCVKFTDLIAIDRQLSLHLSTIKPLLLLSGDYSHRNSFRSICHYGPLYSFDYLQSIQNLKRGRVKDVYSLLEPYFLATEKKWIQQLEKASSEGRAEYDFTEIIRMADEGKIKTLYISEEIFDWGNINCKDKTYTRHKIQMDAFDDDLLDDLAEIVFAKNGQIIVLPAEMFPKEKTVAGIIRSTTEQYIEYKNRERNTT